MNYSQRSRSLIGVMMSMAVVNLVYGISFPLLALVLDQQGVSKTLIGLNTVVQAAAILMVAPIAPRLMNRFSAASIMQLSALTLAALFLLLGALPSVGLWFILRLLVGAATALLWIASESLINELAEEHWRGRIIAVYSSVGAAGFALGPLLLIATGSDGMLPFVATASLVGLAALPLWMVKATLSPANPGKGYVLWKLFRIAPVVMLANVVYAASVESMITFFPLFGIRMGLSQEVSLLILTTIAVGGMLLVLPLGWLADRVSRLGLLTACVLLSMIGFLLMPWFVQAPLAIVLVYAFCFGGVEGMIYALGVTLVGERFKGQDLALATTAFTVAWGVGTIIGPMLSGIGMDLFGKQVLPFVAASFFALYLPLPLMAWLESRRKH